MLRFFFFRPLFPRPHTSCINVPFLANVSKALTFLYRATRPMVGDVVPFFAPQRRCCCCWNRREGACGGSAAHRPSIVRSINNNGSSS